MGRILPGDITKPFQARRAEQIGFRDSFATRVGESALKSLLTPQGLATGAKLVAPFIKMGGQEEGLTEAALGLSPAAEVAAKRVTPPAKQQEEQPVDWESLLPPGFPPKLKPLPFGPHPAPSQKTPVIEPGQLQQEFEEQEAEKARLAALQEAAREPSTATPVVPEGPLTPVVDPKELTPVIEPGQLAKEFADRNPIGSPVLPPGQLAREFAAQEAKKAEADKGKKGPIYTIEDGQAVLDPEAKQYLIGMASRLGGDPDQIIRALIPESSMSTTSVNPDSGASGLIQFTDVAINEMKRRKLVPKELTKEAIRTMTAKEQLQLAEKYFGMYSKIADYSKPGEFSVAIFGPEGLGKKRSHVLYRKGTGKAGQRYSQNARVDSEDPEKRKGYITVDDYLKFKDREVGKFQKRARLPVFETEADEPEKIEPIPELAISDERGAEASLEQPEAKVTIPAGAAPVDQKATATAPEEPAAQKKASPQQEQAMLRSLAKAGSFRDQQRYIEGVLRRGDLDANQVQALTMAAGLIRDRMQPRTLAEALFAAERGTTVGDLWFDKTMRGVTGAKEQSGITPYQREMLAQGERKFEDKKFETQRTLFMKDVTNNVQGIRRLRNAYDRMSADEALEKNILTDAKKHIAGMGRYEREMNKILAQARRPNANIDELEKRYSKVAAELTRAKSRLGSIVSKSKNADRVERYTGDIEVGDEGDVDAARQAMGQ
jgi:hypothetical protein